MACRLALLLAFLGLVLAVTTKAASAHRTTITTIMIDDEDQNPARSSQGGPQRCRERALQGHPLLHCRQYLSRGRKILAMRGGIDEPERQQRLNECCQQLRQVEEQCRCEGLRKIVKEERQREHLRGQELREVVERAQNLPSICRVPPQRCEVNIRAAEGGGY